MTSQTETKRLITANLPAPTITAASREVRGSFSVPSTGNAVTSATGDPAAAAAKVLLLMRKSIESLIDACVCVCEAKEKFAGDRGATDKFIDKLVEGGLLPIAEARLGFGSTKLMKLCTIGDSADLLWRPEILPFLQPGYTVGYHLVLLYEAVGEEVDRLVQILRASPGGLTREYLITETKKAKHPKPGSSDAVTSPDLTNKTVSDLVKVGQRAALIALTPSGRDLRLLRGKYPDAQTLPRCLPVHELVQDSAVAVVLARIADLPTVAETLLPLCGFNTFSYVLLPEKPTRPDVTNIEVIVVAERGRGNLFPIYFDRWPADDGPLDARSIAARLAPTASQRLHVFATDGTEGWTCVVGDDSWADLPTRIMRELLTDLVSAVAAKSRAPRVALLLSGGIDSLSVGIALSEAGKDVRAYTYELEGYASRDRAKAEGLAQHFGWPLCIITVPTASIRDDFMRLAIEQRCRKKVHFEVTLPLLYLFARIQEDEVWSGFNADDHYGNTRKVVLEQARMVREGIGPAERKDSFDAQRHGAFIKTTTSAEATWWYARRVAAQHGKSLSDPYLDEAVRQYFMRFDHDQLASLKKPIVREALAGQFRDLPGSSIAVGVRLQIGGGVDSLFRTLLQDPAINRFEKPYTSVSALCQRWAREVTRDPMPFLSELAALPSQPVAQTRIGGSGEYRPYTMDDVRRASAEQRFTVVSTFAGGGGSSLGYGLASGRVRLASEFVLQAVHTYRANFPDCPLDTRDIRKITSEENDIQ